MGDGLGRPVTLQALPLEAVVPTFAAAGVSRNSAELLREMYDAVNRGRLVFEGAGALPRRGRLSPQEVLGPLLAGAPA